MPKSAAETSSSRVMTGKRIAIVGAGVAGLAAAYDLARAGHQVTIFEAAPEAGGLAAGFKAADWDWSLEKFYHHWFASDKHMLGLIDELGWRDQVIFRRPYTVVFFDGKFQPLDSYVEALEVQPAALLHSGCDSLRGGGRLSPAHPLVAASGEIDRRCLDAQMGPGAGLRHDLAADAGRQVRRGKPARRQHGLVLGQAQVPHDPARHVPGRVSSLHRQAGRRGARPGHGNPPELPGREHHARASRERPGRLVVATASGPETFDAVISTSSPALMSPPGARSAGGVYRQPARAQVDGRGGAGDLAEAPVDPVVLAQPAQRGRLPVSRPGGAHQLHGRRTLRGRSPDLLRRLPGSEATSISS